MKRLFAVFVLIVLLISAIMAAPSLAQEVTPVPTVPDTQVITVDSNTPTSVIPADQVTVIQNENPVLVAALVVAGLIIAVFGAFILYLAHKGFNSLPEWAKDLIQYNQPYLQGEVTAGFDTLDRMATLTPNTLDDMLVKYGRDWVEQRIKTFFDEPPKSPPTEATKQQT